MNKKIVAIVFSFLLIGSLSSNFVDAEKQKPTRDSICSFNNPKKFQKKLEETRENLLTNNLKNDKIVTNYFKHDQILQDNKNTYFSIFDESKTQTIKNPVKLKDYLKDEIIQNAFLLEHLESPQMTLMPALLSMNLPGEQVWEIYNALKDVKNKKDFQKQIKIKYFEFCVLEKSLKSTSQNICKLNIVDVPEWKKAIHQGHYNAAPIMLKPFILDENLRKHGLYPSMVFYSNSNATIPIAGTEYAQSDDYLIPVIAEMQQVVKQDEQNPLYSDVNKKTYQEILENLYDECDWKNSEESRYSWWYDYSDELPEIAKSHYPNAVDGYKSSPFEEHIISHQSQEHIFKLKSPYPTDNSYQISIKGDRHAMNTSTCLTDIDGKPVMDLENCNTDVNNLYQIYYDNALHLMDTDTGKCLKNVYSQKLVFSDCTVDDSQKWLFSVNGNSKDPMIRSVSNPHYCLVYSSIVMDDLNLEINKCDAPGNAYDREFFVTKSNQKKLIDSFNHSFLIKTSEDKCLTITKNDGKNKFRQTECDKYNKYQLFIRINIENQIKIMPLSETNQCLKMSQQTKNNVKTVELSTQYCKIKDSSSQILPRTNYGHILINNFAVTLGDYNKIIGQQFNATDTKQEFSFVNVKEYEHPPYFFYNHYFPYH